MWLARVQEGSCVYVCGVLGFGMLNGMRIETRVYRRAHMGVMTKRIAQNFDFDIWRMNVPGFQLKMFFNPHNKSIMTKWTYILYRVEYLAHVGWAFGDSTGLF